MTLSDKAKERPDLDPGFWCEYAPPRTRVAAEVQRPSHLVNGDTLAVAYMRDWREARRAHTRSAE